MRIANYFKLLQLKSIIDFNKFHELPKVIDEVLNGNCSKINEITELAYYCNQLFDVLIDISIDEGKLGV